METTAALILWLMLTGADTEARAFDDIALHDGRDKVRALMPNGREMSAGHGTDRRLTTISEGVRTVWLCDGVVSQVREQTLGNLMDFSRAVAAREVDHGAPEIRSFHIRGRDEELSRVEASWTIDATIVRVGIIDLGGAGDRMYVFKSMTDPKMCALPRSGSSTD